MYMYSVVVPLYHYTVFCDVIKTNTLSLAVHDCSKKVVDLVTHTHIAVPMVYIAVTCPW